MRAFRQLAQQERHRLVQQLETIVSRILSGQLATDNGSPDGFRVIINSGRIGQQEVQHLHAHIVGGPEPVGPMLKRN